MNKQSKLVTQAKQDIRKSAKHKAKNLVLRTAVNKGKVYPYASTKRNGTRYVTDGRVIVVDPAAWARGGAI